MSLKLQVLGFAGAAPLEGACSCYAVSDREHVVLLDCGPGSLERVSRLGLLPKLEAIVLSHMHLDHMLDVLLFAGELVREQLDGRRPALHVPAKGGRDVLNALDRAFSTSTSNRFDAAFDVRVYRAGDELQLGRLAITFAPTAHTVPCLAARVSDGCSSLVYGADGGPSAAVEELAAGTDLLILEATFAEDAQAASMHGHMTAVQAGETAARAGAGCLLLTHLLPGAGDELAALARRRFHGRVDLAREGLAYDLG